MPQKKRKAVFPGPLRRQLKHQTPEGCAALVRVYQSYLVAGKNVSRASTHCYYGAMRRTCWLNPVAREIENPFCWPRASHSMMAGEKNACCHAGGAAHAHVDDVCRARNFD